MRRFAWALFASLLWTGCVRGIASQWPHSHAVPWPDLALAMVVAFSLYRPSQPILSTAGFAVLSGCLYDLQTSAPTGMHGLCFLILALGAQRARRSLLLASAPQVMVLAFFALLTEESIVLFLTEGLGVRLLWAFAFVVLRAGGAAIMIPSLMKILARSRPRASALPNRAVPILLRGNGFAGDARQ